MAQLFATGIYTTIWTLPYNVALYNIRQYYFQDKKFLKYEENYHVCKENENYGLLQAGVSQQTLKVADRSFKSFFNLIKKAKSGEYRFKDIKMPRYREKGGIVSFHSKCKVWEQRPDTVRQFKEPCQCGVPRIFQGAA
ncbi:MAG: hypothetical protein MR762_03890 [Clostridiales bacterium]|nr:hypothetical protein [Clostridiales bacterium]